MHTVTLVVNLTDEEYKIVARDAVHMRDFVVLQELPYRALHLGGGGAPGEGEAEEDRRMKLLRLFRRYQRTIGHVVALYSTVGAIDSSTGWHLLNTVRQVLRAAGL